MFGIGKIAGVVGQQILGSGNSEKQKNILGNVDPTTGFKKKLDNFMGTASGQALTGAAGGFLTDYRQRRNTRNQFQDLQDEGLNPYEISGGGGGGGQSVAAGNSTLGNGPSMQLQNQQQFAAQQAELDRQNKIDVASTSNTASTQQADVARQNADTARLQLYVNTQLSLKQQLKYTAETNKIDIETKQLGFNFDNTWALKVAGMSAENVKASVVLFNSGLTPEQILKAQGADNPETREKVEALLRKLVSITSVTGRETVGISEFIKTIGDDIFADPVTTNMLGNTVNDLRKYKPNLGKQPNTSPKMTMPWER